MTTTPTRLTNREVAAQLRLIGDMLEIKGENRFRVLAFRNAAESIENLGQDLLSIHRDGDSFGCAQDRLTNIPNVGKGIAADIAQLLETGQIEFLETLKQEVPVGVVDMMRVPDMGPKKAARLWQELDIASIDELKAAAQAGRLRELKGFGARSEQKILQGIELLQRRQDDRVPIGVARPAALALVQALGQALPEGSIVKIELAGSLRRWKETIGDVDILAVSDRGAEVMAAFRSLPQVTDVVASGQTKTRVRLANGLECDLRVVERRHWGAALQYFTGSKEHNVAMRELALKQGWSLNEYGLRGIREGDHEGAKGDREDAKGREGAKTRRREGVEERFFESEEELYAFLGLEWTPPELREDRGEIEAAGGGKLPRLIAQADLQGEVHGHSTWSDGTLSIAGMAAAAMRRGYRYWVVSDHSVGLGIVGGLDDNRLRQQAEEIAALNRGWQESGVDFRLLQGIEVEILADGSLGLPDEVLARLDVVVASIHSSLRQDRDTITARCLKAVRNPHVDILGHPTGRLLGKRPPSDLDVEQVLQVCAETGTVLEINAHPSRLDLNDIYARRAVALGCKIAISTDAHSAEDIALMPYGIATARRAWLTRDDVINTRSAADMLALLKGGRL